MGRRSRIVWESDEFSLPQLKKQAKNRDHFMCGDCGSKKFLAVHHVDFDSAHNELENLITLCRACHKARHRDDPRGPINPLIHPVVDDKRLGSFFYPSMINGQTVLPYFSIGLLQSAVYTEMELRKKEAKQYGQSAQDLNLIEDALIRFVERVILEYVLQEIAEECHEDVFEHLRKVGVLGYYDPDNERD